MIFLLIELTGPVRPVESAPPGLPGKSATLGGKGSRGIQFGAPQPSPAAPSFLTFTTPYTYFFPFVGIASSQDLAIYGVKVMQGTSPNLYSFAIQDRPAIVRAFVSLNSGLPLSGIPGRLYVVDSAGNPVGNVDSPAMTAPSAEGDLGRTLDFSVPGSWLKPGASYYVVVNPDNTVPESSIVDNRYPSSGTIAFNVVYARPLQVVIVPILYLPFGATSSTLPQTSSISYLEGLPIKLLPIPNATYTVRSPIEYAPTSFSNNLNAPSGSGWQNLLDLVSNVHASEDPSGSKVYYGLIDTSDAHAGCGGCITGLGWVGDNQNPVLPTSIGWSGSPNGDSGASLVMTHEMGHNFGREHVLCQGSEGSPDPSYPYAGGLIGVWGIDILTPTLYNPSSYADYMSYCTNRWTSDYTFAGIKAFRENSPLPFVPVRAGQTTPQAMYVSGIIDPNGTVTFSPIYEQAAPVSNFTNGSHVLQVLGKDGQVLASFPFEPARIADSNGATGFGFFLPMIEGRAGLRIKKGNDVLATKMVTAQPVTTDFAGRTPNLRAAANANILEWAPVTHPNQPVNYRVRISHDNGATWQVVGLGLHAPQITIPNGEKLSDALVEIQSTDGIHVSTQTRDLRDTP